MINVSGSPMEEILDALRNLGYPRRKFLSLQDMDVQGAEITQADIVYGCDHVGRYDFVNHDFIEGGRRYEASETE